MREPCHMDDCERPSAGHGLCSTHWLRWKTYGDPFWVTPRAERRTTRKAYGCAVDGCPKKHHAFGYCANHAQAWKKYADPLADMGKPGRHMLRVPGYDAAHKRVSRARGPARQFECVDCAGPAEEWSYRGGSTAEALTETGLAYSPNPNDYEPRCKGCHRRRDRSLDHSVHRNERGQFITVSQVAL
jgi:hypothetical protein